MILDSGAVTICGVSSTEGEGPSPVYTMVPKLTAPFGDRVVGATRYYAAAKTGAQIDRSIRIWRADNIAVRDLAQIGTTWYLIHKVTQTADSDGLLVTDLDLEQRDGNVWEAEHGDDTGG